MDIATFGAGCFWCIEAILLNVPGINSIEVGYTGGHIDNPTYKMICEGNTGHAEVAQIQFDNKKITYEQLLFIFFDIHDPTTLNRQGNDVGTQYRSSIFYHDSTQKELAEKAKATLQSKYNNKIVTEITSLEKFYIAEDYHQNYYNNNKDAPYCNFVIKPKVEIYSRIIDDLVIDHTVKEIDWIEPGEKAAANRLKILSRVGNQPKITTWFAINHWHSKLIII